MAHPPGAFLLFSWFTALLVSSGVGGSQLTGGSASWTASTSPRNSRSGGRVHTIELLKVARPPGPDLRFSRQCRAISRFHCRTEEREPRGTHCPDSSVGRARVRRPQMTPLSRRIHGHAPLCPSSLRVQPHAICPCSDAFVFPGPEWHHPINGEGTRRPTCQNRTAGRRQQKHGKG